LRKYCVTACRFGKKPGFFGFDAMSLQKPGFCENTALQPADSVKNPVSLVLMGCPFFTQGDLALFLPFLNQPEISGCYRIGTHSNHHT
jgi:hypothetical protein